MDYLETLPPREKEQFKPVVIIPIAKWKKILIAICVIVVIVLILSYSFSAQISGVVHGLIESDTIHDKTLDVDGTKIIFLNETYEKLKEVYYADIDKEIKVCFLGKIENNTYYLDEIFYPEIISQEYDEVVSKGCPENTLLDLHSHPKRHCLASQQDISNKEEGDKLYVVMCEEVRFNFY